MKIEEENNKSPVLFQLFYDPGFNVKKTVAIFADLVYDVNRNKDHTFEDHLFKPWDVLLNEAFVYCKAPKSVFEKNFQKIVLLIQVQKHYLIQTSVPMTEELDFFTLQKVSSFELKEMWENDRSGLW